VIPVALGVFALLLLVDFLVEYVREERKLHDALREALSYVEEVEGGRSEIEPPIVEQPPRAKAPAVEASVAEQPARAKAPAPETPPAPLAPWEVALPPPHALTGDEGFHPVDELRRLFHHIVSRRGLSSELIICYRELAVMYRAGLSLLSSIAILARQTTHPILREALETTYTKVGQGWSLSKAMNLFPSVFTPLYVRLLEAGEVSGNIDTMLEKIASHGERVKAARMKLQSALTYPAFIFVLSIVALIALPALALQGIFQFLADMRVPLPPATIVLIMLSSALRSPFVVSLFMAACLAASFGAILAWRREVVRRIIQRLLLRVPLLGRTLLEAEMAIFARTLSVLYDAGVPVMHALEVAAANCSVIIIRERLMEARKIVMSGTALHRAFTQVGGFSPLFIQFVLSGEHSGKLPEFLRHSANMYEQNAESTIDMFTAAVQPVVLLVIGIVVGFILVATLAPMLNLLNAI
jgi:type IV pilus assembly protein PilC